MPTFAEFFIHFKEVHSIDIQQPRANSSQDLARFLPLLRPRNPNQSEVSLAMLIGKMSSCEGQLRSTITREQGTQWFECTMCFMKLGDKQSLTAHLANGHRLFLCPFVDTCCACFDTMESLVWHGRGEHDLSQSAVEHSIRAHSTTIPDQQTCAYCDKPFRDVAVLRTH